MTLQDSQTGPHLVEKRIKLAAHNSEGFQVANFLLKLPANNTKNQRGKQSFRVLWPRRSLAPSSREKCRVVQEGMGRRTGTAACRAGRSTPGREAGETHHPEQACLGQPPLLDEVQQSSPDICKIRTSGTKRNISEPGRFTASISEMTEGTAAT